jgi:hypothetical protein
MQAKTIIIFAILVVYIDTAIMARRLHSDASEEDNSLEQHAPIFSHYSERA